MSNEIRNTTTLNDVPSGERVHIGFFGIRNAGKSSVVNAVTNQQLALVSAVNTEFKRLLSVRCEGRKFDIPEHASADFFYRLSDRNKGSSDSPLFSMHPFFAFKTWQRSANFTDAELAAAFQSILDANLAMVTGSDPRLALENLVRKIAGTGVRS